MTSDSKPMRYAIVTVPHPDAIPQIRAYLPDNYRVIGRTAMRASNTVVVLIGGEDHADWTLDEYVIPRLASGLIFAEEIA
jgi:hypothetical protein